MEKSQEGERRKAIREARRAEVEDLEVKRRGKKEKGLLREAVLNCARKEGGS